MADYIFNVAALLGMQSGAAREYDIEAPRKVLDVPELDGPVRGQVRLLVLDGSILAVGRFQADVVQPCARCLVPVRASIVFETEDCFVPMSDPLTGQAVSAEDDADSWRLDAHHNLDLGPLLREGVIAALPLKPLCRPACPGIQPGSQPLEQSGAATPSDPRWESLRRLRDEMFPGSGESHG